MDRRRRKRQRREKPKKAVVGAEVVRSIHDVSDDLLWKILLGVDSPIWLIRAACACKRWRRVITDGGGAGADEGRAFLRLASSLHAPTVVGLYHNYRAYANFDAAYRFVPSSSPTAPAIDESRFAVSRHFLPKYSHWHVSDCYGGLVLLRSVFRTYPSVGMPNLIVYDPLTRRVRKIYSPPPPHKQIDGANIRYAFLLDGDGNDNISISNFRVFYSCFLSAYVIETCVFSFSTANGGDWHFPNDQRSIHCFGNMAGHVDRSMYVGMLSGSVEALDNNSLVFSKVALPIRPDLLKILKSSTFTVVHHGNDGGLGADSSPRTSIVHVRGEELELFRRVHGSGDWVLEHSIPNLSEATRGLFISLLEKKGMAWQWTIMKEKGIAWRAMASGVNADGATFAILSAYRSELSYYSVDRLWFFSIDVNTMELQVLPEVPYCDTTRSIFSYTLPWPQFLRAYP